jgi:hypothetical protein
MSRLLLLACAPLLLLSVACGGGNDDGQDEDQGDDAATQAVAGDTPTPTPELLPTPPDASEDEVILQTAAGETTFAPTMAEFRGLPHVTIEADGSKEGVSLAELGRRVSAAADSFVTIQGTRRDGRMIQFVREPLSEVGDESVLVLDESGRLNFYSSALGEEEWLINVVAVTFP